MRLGEKDPATVNGSIGQSSTSLGDLSNAPEVSVTSKFGSFASATSILNLPRTQRQYRHSPLLCEFPNFFLHPLLLPSAPEV